jgi:spore germination protein
MEGRKNPVRKKWWLIGGLALMLAIVGVWGYRQALNYRRLQARVEAEYQRSFFTLVGHVETLDTRLAKAQVSGSSQQTLLNLAEVWRHGYAAQESLGSLPLSHNSLERTGKFLTQLADYTYVLAKKSAGGQELDDKDIEQLAQLQEQSIYLSGELHQVQQQLSTEQLTWTKIGQTLGQELTDSKGATSAFDGFKAIEKQMLDYPALVYDGPFSEHIRKEPRSLPETEVSLEQAKEFARKFAGGGEGYNLEISENPDTAGIIPCYSVQMTPTQAPQSGGSGRITMDVTKRGGLIVWLMKDRVSAGKNISLEQAQEIGRRFLEERGYSGMQVTSALVFSNTATIAYVATQDEVLIYPDLVKVNVALDNGEVIGFEGMNYLMSHTNRDLPAPTITVEDARAKVNKRLFIERERRALIPLETMAEVLCYEFKGRMNGEEFLVYINATNGNEEQILRLVRTEEGVIGL